VPASQLFYPESHRRRNQMPFPEHVRPVRFLALIQVGRENPVTVVAVRRSPLVLLSAAIGP
jgi:hypothetical protein